MPDDTEPVAAPDEPDEATLARNALHEKRFTREIDKVINPRFKALYAHLGVKGWDEFQKLSADNEGGAPAPAAKRDDGAAKELMIRGLMDEFDFLSKDTRKKLVAEFMAMTRLADGDALILLGVDGGDALALNTEELRKLLPPEAVLARTTGGSGGKQPEEAATKRRGARDEDEELIDKGRRSQAFYTANRDAILAAERRLRR